MSPPVLPDRPPLTLVYLVTLALKGLFASLLGYWNLVDFPGSIAAFGIPFSDALRPRKRFAIRWAGQRNAAGISVGRRRGLPPDLYGYRGGADRPFPGVGGRRATRSGDVGLGGRSGPVLGYAVTR